MPPSIEEASVLLVSLGFHPQQIRGVYRYAREKNWRIVLDTHFDGTLPVEWPGTGVIAIHALNRTLACPPLLSPIPFVSIAHEALAQGGALISVDHQAVGEAAAQHLWERGYRSFAYAPLVHDSFDQAREGGYRDFLRAKGALGVSSLPPLYVRVQGQLQVEWETRRRTVASLLLSFGKRTAIFAYNNSVASDLMQICQEVGLAVPEDIALLGVDEDPALGELHSTALSSVSIDYARIGYEAAAELDRQMLSQARVMIHAIPPAGVVARASTGTPASDDARLQEALAFIQANFTNASIGVNDVAAALQMSRRSIERLFREKRETTVSECITLARIQEAARILRSDARSRVIEVAARVGFSTQTHFFRRFRRQFGLSPKAYLRQHSPGTREPQPLTEGCWLG